MKLVIKIGGDAAETPRARRNLAKQIAGLSRSGFKAAVVHGGGKTLTRVLADLGIPTCFHDGLRVTDAPTRDAALMVLAGMINKQWVAEIEAQGQRAVGLCGGDGGLMKVRKLVARNGKRTAPLGFVGKPEKVDPSILNMAFEQGMIPVIATLATGPRGQYYNVNADDFAAALANALPADRLVYLTESGGVWDARRKRLPEVRASEIEGLIEKGIVRDGMIPKLRSCAEVLKGGVGEIDIISSSAPSDLTQLLKGRSAVGTRIVR